MFIKNRKHIPIACELYIKIDYPNILQGKYAIYCVEGVFDWFIIRMSYYNKLLKKIFIIIIPFKEDRITPLYPNILEDKYKSYCGEGVFDWFINRMRFYNNFCI